MGISTAEQTHAQRPARSANARMQRAAQQASQKTPKTNPAQNPHSHAPDTMCTPASSFRTSSATECPPMQARAETFM